MGWCEYYGLGLVQQTNCHGEGRWAHRLGHFMLERVQLAKLKPLEVIGQVIEYSFISSEWLPFYTLARWQPLYDCRPWDHGSHFHYRGNDCQCCGKSQRGVFSVSNHHFGLNECRFYDQQWWLCYVRYLPGAELMGSPVLFLSFPLSNFNDHRSKHCPGNFPDRSPKFRDCWMLLLRLRSGVFEYSWSFFSCSNF